MSTIPKRCSQQFASGATDQLSLESLDHRVAKEHAKAASKSQFRGEGPDEGSQSQEKSDQKSPNYNWL
jgi:hypothetical protein